MHFVPKGEGPEVAMTLDACMGETDMRILQPLIDHAIPVTIFATKRWLDHNPVVIKVLQQHKELFQIEDHGAQHLPAIIGNDHPYGLAPAGTAAAVQAEVLGGSMAVTQAFGSTPKWYRDATALYTRDAMALVTQLGFRIGGFSLNGDIGASVSAPTAYQRISAAKSGDVIISHINQPTRPAGAGVIAGTLALRDRGFTFKHLDEIAITAIA